MSKLLTPQQIFETLFNAGFGANPGFHANAAHIAKVAKLEVGEYEKSVLALHTPAPLGKDTLRQAQEAEQAVLQVWEEEYKYERESAYEAWYEYQSER